MIQEITATDPVARWSETDRQMMARALELAAKGIGQVSPGPLVGCVIVDQHGAIVGEGFYLYDSVKHAETLALETAGPRAHLGTAYVSLEPHAHHGRTVPCTDALIEAGITRVVAPIEDPNPKVSGRGFDHLRSVKLQVNQGLMEHEAERLNEKYLHFMRTDRPFVHLKLATSLDGKIATHTGDSRWITGRAARDRVQELRHEYDAVLVGAGTAVTDNPRLTDRSGKRRRRPLTRIVLDSKLSLPVDSELVKSAGENPLLIFTGEVDKARLAEFTKMRAEIVQDPSGGRNLLAVLSSLKDRSIQSILIEGGANVAANFLEAGLVNKVTFFIAPMIIGGRNAPSAIGGVGAEQISEALQLRNVEIIRHENDLEVTGYLP